MEEREKGGQEKQEFLGLKLKLVSKSRGGVSTPPPSWTFQPNFQQNQEKRSNLYHNNNNLHNISSNNINNCNNNSGISGSSVTARKLGANLWEVSPHLNSIAKMSRHHKGGNGGGYEKNKGLEIHTVLEDPHDGVSDEQPVSTGSFHRHIAASLLRHHRSVNRNGREVQPVSPASYNSSMEITPYNPAATPSSSLDIKGRVTDPSCNLKTSTELLKVLNRIWCLEEQHTSNVSLLKGLKTELDCARTRIKDLLREKQKDRQVIDDLMKQVAEHKLVRRNMEQERTQSTLQSVRQELDDERKLRKRSESLHRKMAREISEMKHSFSKALNDLERERRARILLEDLCDEFAMGIRDYEQELRSQKYKNEKEQVHREHVDSLVLHISEAWLDERVQMKLAEDRRKDLGEKSMIVDKLRPEIETFLKARQTSDSKDVELHNKSSKGNGIRRQSLESYPLNDATSGPQNIDDEDEDGSIDSESNCFELTKNFDGACSNEIYTNIVNHNTADKRSQEETERNDVPKKNGECQESSNGRCLSSLQARFAKHMAQMNLSYGHTQNNNQEAIAEEGILERRSKRYGCRVPGNSNRMFDTLMRNNSSSIEGERIYPESDLADESHGHYLIAGPASPVKNWESIITLQDHDRSESSSRWPRASKENTLKARLLEARLERRNASKASKGAG